MNVHQHAGMTIHGQLLLVVRLRKQGWRVERHGPGIVRGRFVCSDRPRKLRSAASRLLKLDVAPTVSFCAAASPE